MQLVIHNWANFQLHVSYATKNQLHKIVAKCQISSSGGHTLSQDLGPLHRRQRCGGVDRQCDLEVLHHSTQIVIKISKLARHIGLVQCGHPAQAGKGEHSPGRFEPETPT